MILCSGERILGIYAFVFQACERPGAAACVLPFWLSLAAAVFAYSVEYYIFFMLWILCIF